MRLSSVCAGQGLRVHHMPSGTVPEPGPYGTFMAHRERDLRHLHSGSDDNRRAFLTLLNPSGGYPYHDEGWLPDRPSMPAASRIRT
jgi:hypothetical protein